MRDDPTLIRQLGGDLCRAAEHLNSTVAGSQQACQAMAISEQLDQLRREFTAEVSDGKPSAAERMMIDRVVTCWLTLHALELEAAVQYQQAPGSPPPLDKAIDRAHRRFVHALTSLTRLRKLNRSLAFDFNVDAFLGMGPQETSALESNVAGERRLE